jgi:hypothetical protein
MPALVHRSPALPPIVRNALVGIAIAIAAYYAVNTAVGLSMARKLFVCMQAEPHLEHATPAQQRQAMEHMIGCVDRDLNFVEHWFFDKDEALASIHTTGKP